MDHVGTISEGVWSSLNGMCSDEAGFMATLLGSLPNHQVPNCYASSTLWPYSHDPPSGNNDSDVMYCSYSSDDTNYSTVNSFLPSSSPENNHHDLQRSAMYYDHMMEADDFLSQDVIISDRIAYNQNSRKFQIDETETLKDDHTTRSPREPLKKRSRNTNGEAQNKRNVKSKRVVKLDDNGDNNDNNKIKNASLHRQSSNSIYSEEHSNDPHETNGVTSGLNSGKKRANRGSATDPQSLYARKRRERINERLRILQNLVPNGTKVDISTMLEEAVQYVKFLQLQIKLLSSDDLWMYAPIAYNGMDIGLDLKISQHS